MEKHTFRFWINSVCTLLLSMFGLSSCLPVKYGVPDVFGEETVSGQVTNQTGEPIEGILVEKAYREGHDDFVLNEYHKTYTDEYGRFSMTIQMDVDTMYLVAQDVDGENNGTYVANYSEPILRSSVESQRNIRIVLLREEEAH